MKSVLELEDIASLAIRAALTQQWAEAIRLNQEILVESHDSIEALNRLGRAYKESREIDKAKETFQKTLSFDPYNPIALKNLEKLHQGVRSSSAGVAHELFLEEPGKTRIERTPWCSFSKFLSAIGLLRIKR